MKKPTEDKTEIKSVEMVTAHGSEEISPEKKLRAPQMSSKQCVAEAITNFLNDEDGYSSSDDSYYDENSFSEFSHEEKIEQAMTVDEIAKMLGSVKFSSITSDTTAATQDSDEVNAPTAVHSLSDSLKKTTPATTGEPGALYPMNVLRCVLEGNGFDSDKISPESSFFEPNTDGNIEGYTTDILNAVRSQDVEKLEKLRSQGHPMQCRNKFGESILHLACRRGFFKVVDFLVNVAKISINIRDDYGRTPLHDACWVIKPDFDLITILIRSSPDLILIRDKRGFLPLQYVKKDQYAEWCDYLKKSEALFVLKCV
eukprot:CAMPEP_0194073192 /NCGR_PEP_ID=MMETSP0149-20130528/705_1 /TAXON_ID=122233 /ORGANISM="Chaetoceros debilis, Strain MM31A-1" /LENGTH=312 /DNA_ID=CAMNT_0038753169 /DNA_START=128 /DNA_END=1066 /DNA_ORIENTATION=-